MAGTLGGALEARGISAGGGRLRADAQGEVELEGNTLVLKRVHVTYRFSPDEGTDRAKVERVHGFHAEHCPVARSIGGSVEITTGIEYV
ncbi:OsmC family protein [Qaidamihabitans albus]|uniref:OsmC family protein n=1 Tax=Qaidamihabitans albus TaxID=2795733 RepID=UPI0018F10AD8